jgi:hypothetical protein
MLNLSDDTSRSITAGPTKCLGHIVASTPFLAARAASTKLKFTIIDKLKLIDARPIRGRMKLRILHHLLIPST